MYTHLIKFEFPKTMLNINFRAAAQKKIKKQDKTWAFLNVQAKSNDFVEITIFRQFQFGYGYSNIEFGTRNRNGDKSNCYFNRHDYSLYRNEAPLHCQCQRYL